RIFQHDGGEIARGEGGVDVPRKPAAAEVGQVAAVIDVSVTQNHAVHLARRERELPVPFDRLGPAALEEPAFQQNLPLIDLQKVHRPRRGARGAKEMDAHSCSESCSYPEWLAAGDAHARAGALIIRLLSSCAPPGARTSRHG